MTGFVHSIETFGAVDGPGVRLVVFLQGCPMRCAYCHNPDTQIPECGTEMTIEEILQLYERNRSFYQKGGLTLTGGEPLMQIQFVTELFRAAKAKGIHTCLDTSGICFHSNLLSSVKQTEALLSVTDLIMLDIKHIDDNKHRDLTGHSNREILAFARFLSDRNFPVWIRHVIVPDWTDDTESLTNLGRFLATLKNIQALDLIPYHTMGEQKYRQLGIPYRLAGIPAMTQETCAQKGRILKEAYAAAQSDILHSMA